MVHAKPSFYANRGTLSLYAREIRMVGLGELLARIERRRQLLAAEGLFAAERKRRLPFLPGTVGLVTGSQQRRRARRPGERQAPLAGRPVRGPVRRDAGHQLRRRGDRAARPARPGPRGRRHRDRPRRRLGRGPAAVLRRGAAAGGLRGAHPGRLRDRPRAGQPAARPGRRRAGLHPHRRRQAGRARRRRGDAARRAPARPRPPVRSAPGWPASSTPSTPCAPARRWPTPAAASSARAEEVDALRDRARRTLHHQLDRAGNDLGHQLARVRGHVPAGHPAARLRRGPGRRRPRRHQRRVGRAPTSPCRCASSTAASP